MPSSSQPIVKVEHHSPSPLSADPPSLSSSSATVLNDGEVLKPVPSYVKYTTIWLRCAYARLFMSRYPFTFIKSVVYLNRLQELLDELHPDNTYMLSSNDELYVKVRVRKFMDPSVRLTFIVDDQARQRKALSHRIPGRRGRRYLFPQS